MRLVVFATLALCLAVAPVNAAGFRFIDIPADGDMPAIHGAIWSPCAQPAGTIELRDLVLPGVKDCPVSGDKLPLVVVSHGRTGSFVGHHDTAEALADAGFIVAAINHPGDTAADPSRTNELSVFVERPTDIKRLIDFMLGAAPVAAQIDPQRIGFFGFSRGGYTGLVLAGTEPHFFAGGRLCRGSPQFCEEIRGKPLPHDPRIKAAVIADPLAVFFDGDSYAAVKTAVQLWASQQGGDGVEPDAVAAVDKSLAAPHEYHVVPNSRHFAFFAPCPPEFAQTRAEICTDPPGFDRIAFHRQFNASVLAYFRAHLPPP